MYSNNTKPVTAAPKRFNISSHFVAKNFAPINQMNWKRLCSTAVNSSVSLYEIKPSTKAMYRVVGLTAWSQLAISAYFGPLLITKAEQFGDPSQATAKKVIGVGVIAYGIAINIAFNIFRKKIALKVDYVSDKVKVGVMNFFTATKTIEYPTSAMIYKKQLPIGESSFYTLSFRNPYNQDKTIRYYLDKQGNYPNKHILENLEQRAATN